MNKFVLLLVVVANVLAIKKSEAGNEDWSIKTIGTFQDVSFINKDSIAVISRTGDLAYINKTNGEVLSRVQLGEASNIFTQGSRGKFESVYSTQQSAALLKTTIKTNEQKIIAKLSSPVLRTYCQNSVCITVTADNVGLINSFKQLDENNLIKVQQGKFVYSFKSNQNQIHAISRNNNTICSHIISFSDKIQQNSKNCFDPNGKVTEFFGRFLIVTTKNNTAVFQLGSNKQIYRTQGIIYKVLPISSSVIFTLNQVLTKIQFPSLNKEVINVSDIVEENTKGKIFSISKSEETKTFSLQVIGERRVTWTTSSDYIINVWVNQLTQLDYQMIIQYGDLRVQYFEFGTGKVKSQINSQWHRQQSLSQVENVLFLDFLNQQELSNPYYQTLLYNYKTASPITLFVQRMQFEIGDFIQSIKSTINDISTILKSVNIGNLFQGKQFLTLPPNDSYEKGFGMIKIIIASTKNNMIYALDSKTSNIIWKSKLGFTFAHVKLFRMISDETQRVIISSYDKRNGYVDLFEINWHNGAISKLSEIKVQSQPLVFQIEQSTIGVKQFNNIQYFSLDKNAEQNKHSFIFFNINSSNISCQSIDSNGKLLPLWNMVLPQKQQILKSVTSFKNDKQSKLPLFKDNIVYLKNVDYTNFAVLTKSIDSNNLNIYVINGENGHVLLHKYKRNVDFEKQINLIYDENTIMVSYFSILNKMHEIWVIQQYKDKTYTSVSEVINQYFQNNQQEDSSHHKTRNNIMVFESVFGSPLYIKNMYVSTSKQSLIKRNVYIITRDNQIYVFDRRLITTRRPSSQSPIENQKYPPYDYLIPIIPTNFVTYNQNLKDLRNIQFSPSALESTFLLIAYGQDIFTTRCRPDGTFDMITNQFNYPFLLLVVILVTIILQIIKKKVKKARIAKSFKY